MRTGLMTCYIDNYGACLQAYALSKTIEEIAGQCEIIQYTPYYDIEQSKPKTIPQEAVSLKLKRALLHPVKFAKRQNYFQKSKMRAVKFQSFRDEHLKFGDTFYKTYEQLKANPPQLDAFVCGSDQIWNPVIHRNTNVPAYFLDFVPKGKKRIAYSPSIGVQELPEECKGGMAEFLTKFDYLSVREQRGLELISEISDAKAQVIIDPTLLLNGEKWSQIAKSVSVSGEYIFCYLFNENSETYKFVSAVAKQTGLKVVTLPYSFNDIYSKSEKIYDAGPCEFLYLIKNAAMVITDSFHATAFSLNFNKDFYCILRNKVGEKNNMNSRIHSILDIAGLTSRIVTDLNVDISEFAPIDYEIVNSRIQNERERGRKYLYDALLSKEL